MMITAELVERALVSANRLRIHALNEFHGLDIIPDAVGIILILGDAVLPGYISRITLRSQICDQDKLIRSLEEEDPFADTNLTTWIEREGKSYPETTAYVLALDEVRRLAIDFLMQNQKQ